jgi:hypothetical protein
MIGDLPHPILKYKIYDESEDDYYDEDYYEDDDGDDGKTEEITYDEGEFAEGDEPDRPDYFPEIISKNSNQIDQVFQKQAHKYSPL